MRQLAAMRRLHHGGKAHALWSHPPAQRCKAVYVLRRALLGGKAARLPAAAACCLPEAEEQAARHCLAAIKAALCPAGTRLAEMQRQAVLQPDKERYASRR